MQTLPKILITNYGIFYEGQKLSQYTLTSGSYYYLNDVIIDKFLFHNYKNSRKMFFRFFSVGGKQKWTLPISYLGIFYKIKKNS